MTADENYRATFNPSVAGEALRHALDIRKFEIQLYWQRAAYFWALIAATFAGYFAVLAAAASTDRDFNAYVRSCVGLTFSVAWVLTNRGSKFWQENWECHVDMLEDSVTGPLYKTVLHEKREPGSLAMLEGPAPYSVSRINQWISVFTMAIWGVLIVNVLPKFHSTYDISCRHLIVAVVTVVALILMFLRGKSRIISGRKQIETIVRSSVVDG